MQDILEKIIRNFREFFVGLDAQKKVAMLVVGAIIIAGLASIVIWATKTRFEVLYTDLNRDDSKKIAILLEENKLKSLKPLHILRLFNPANVGGILSN